MSDLALFVFGLLVSFLFLGGALIHFVVRGQMDDVDEPQQGAANRGSDPGQQPENARSDGS